MIYQEYLELMSLPEILSEKAIIFQPSSCIFTVLETNNKKVILSVIES